MTWVQNVKWLELVQKGLKQLIVSKAPLLASVSNYPIPPLQINGSFTETTFRLLLFHKPLYISMLYQAKKKGCNFLIDIDMDARILQHAMLFLLFFIFFISDAVAAESTLAAAAIKETKKLDYQENQIAFSSAGTRITQHDTAPGDVPIVNPTTPGTTPIVNPTSPPPPATTTGPTTTAPASSGGSWCIASSSASQTALQVALDYACGFGGADCSAIQPGASCYDPNTVRGHASYAFNNYYQKNPIPTSCVFGGTAQLTNTDPSNGNCHYASSTSTSMTPPVMPTTPPALPTTPPSTTTPINPYTPGTGGGYGSEPTGYDYGSEPTGMPSSAETMQLSLLLLSKLNCFIILIATAIYL